MGCTYCRSDRSVSVQKRGKPGPVDVGVFCNDGCLTADSNDEGLMAGNTCAWTPDEAGKQR